jgi:hypothetical protein
MFLRLNRTKGLSVLSHSTANCIKPVFSIESPIKEKGVFAKK